MIVCQKERNYPGKFDRCLWCSERFNHSDWLVLYWHAGASRKHGWREGLEFWLHRDCALEAAIGTIDIGGLPEELLRNVLQISTGNIVQHKCHKPHKLADDVSDFIDDLERERSAKS